MVKKIGTRVARGDKNSERNIGLLAGAKGLHRKQVYCSLCCAKFPDVPLIYIGKQRQSGNLNFWVTSDPLNY